MTPRPRWLSGSVCAAGVLVMALAGCSGGDDSPAPPAGTATPGETTSAPVPDISSNGQATPAIVAAANAFLATLSTAEKDSVLFERGDRTQKQRWSNLPEGLYTRQGLMTGNLNDTQINAFLSVMSATLSSEGFNRVLTEWTADDALAANEGGGGLKYGKRYYWIAIIGAPSATEEWQWQFGGHHVTVNATVKGDDLSLTPSFLGAQPAFYTASGKTLRPLGDIDDEAFALVNSLDSGARGRAVLGGSYIDLVLGPGQDCKTIAPEGLPGSAMSATQQAAFLTLIDHYGGLANDEDAAVREAQLKADLATTYFAWYGPLTTGSAAYFRVTGPHVVIEYSPQKMGGAPTNHIHGIYRDPTNDYGGTVCR